MARSRVELFRDASRQYPDARRHERQVMLDLLAIEPGHVVCDVPAWYGYLAEGVADLSRVICIEPSRAVAATIQPGPKVFVAPREHLPLKDETVDRVGSLVGLHHMKDPGVFIREVHRILRPGGVAGFSEVLVDTSVAAFLDGPVNKYAWAGHRAWFLRPGALSALLMRAGFVDVREKREDVRWVFPSIDAMGSYCRDLLAMDRATAAQVVDAVGEHFDVVVGDDGGVVLPWPLVYARGAKATS